MNFFHKKYKDKTDIELLEIVNDSSKYQDDALNAAIDILTERGVELNSIQQEVKTKLNTEPGGLSSKEKEVTLGRSRFFALIIDLIVLSICSYIIGFVLMFSSLVNDDILFVVSAVLIIGYFTFGNSEMFNGATLGKRHMKLMVVNSHNDQISIWQSLFRTSLIIVPFFLFDLLQKIEFNSSILEALIPALRFSYLLGITYFILTDKKLRRSYHDLIQKTMVRKENCNSVYNLYPRKYSLYFLGITLTVLLIPTVSYLRSTSNLDLINQTTVKEMQSTLEKNNEVLSQIGKEIQQIERVDKINGFNIETTNDTRTDIIIDVRAKYSPFGTNEENLSDLIYSTIKDKTLYIDRLDNVQIVMRYGFNMTLAKFNIEKIENYEQ